MADGRMLPHGPWWSVSRRGWSSRMRRSTCRRSGAPRRANPPISESARSSQYERAVEAGRAGGGDILEQSDRDGRPAGLVLHHTVTDTSKGTVTPR